MQITVDILHDIIHNNTEIKRYVYGKIPRGREFPAIFHVCRLPFAVFNAKRPNVRFSKVPKSFRALKAIFKLKYIKKTFY